MADKDLGTIGVQLGFAVEAFTRRFVAAFEGERAATRARLSNEIAVRLLAGGSPERILADLVAAIARLDAPAAKATP
jgi:hypothetical protein